MAHQEQAANGVSPGVQEGIEFVEGFRSLAIVQAGLDEHHLAAQEARDQFNASVTEHTYRHYQEVGDSMKKSMVPDFVRLELGELALTETSHKEWIKSVSGTLSDMRSDLPRDYRERFGGRKMRVVTIDPSTNAITWRSGGGPYEKPGKRVSHPPEFTGRFQGVNSDSPRSTFSMGNFGRKYPLIKRRVSWFVDLEVQPISAKAVPLVQIELLDE